MIGSDASAVAQRVDAAAQGLDAPRAFLTLSFAQSLDGALAMTAGTRTMLSGRESLEMAHVLRSEHDAVLVGIGTLLVDNPLLSARLERPCPQPRRVVLDRRLRTPSTASIFGEKGGPVCVATTEGAPAGAEAELRAAGAEVWRWPESAFEPQNLRRQLGEHGVRRVMVEGGAQVLSSLLDAGAADYLVVTVCPLITASGDCVRYGTGRGGHLYDLRGGHQTTLGCDVVFDGAMRALVPASP